jgi:hypothetical protein
MKVNDQCTFVSIRKETHDRLKTFLATASLPKELRSIRGVVTEAVNQFLSAYMPKGKSRRQKDTPKIL